MKGPRELKRYLAILRSRAGRRNGVVPGAWLDDLLVLKLERCRKWARRPRHKDRPDRDRT